MEGAGHDRRCKETTQGRCIHSHDLLSIKLPPDFLAGISLQTYHHSIRKKILVLIYVGPIVFCSKTSWA